VCAPDRKTYVPLALPRYDPASAGVIVFDNDDTLVHTSTPVSTILAEQFAVALDVPAHEARMQILEAYSLAQDTCSHMARLHGRDDAWVAGMRAVLRQNLFARLEHVLSPNPRLIARIGRVCERGHVVGVLTAASRDYAHRVLELIHLRDAFHPELVITRDCVGGHYKDRPEPYLAFLERSARIAPGRWHIMVEDNAANLKAAAELGFTTVLVGAASSEAFVHVCYPDVETFLDALLVGEIRPAYPAAAAEMPRETYPA
jgi:beta-phosphoglucomutase-like phosphatase (HAD superfamily)